MGLRTPKESHELRKSLEEDYNKAQEQSKKSESALGVETARRSSKDPSSFRAKGIRIGNKVIGQKELAESERAINDTIDQLAKRSNFKNQQDAFQFKMGLREKFNKTRNLIIKSGLKFESDIRAQESSFDNRVAMINAYTGVAGGIGKMAGFGSGGGSSKEKPSTDYIGDPEEGNKRYQGSKK